MRATRSQPRFNLGQPGANLRRPTITALHEEQMVGAGAGKVTAASLRCSPAVTTNDVLQAQHASVAPAPVSAAATAIPDERSSRARSIGAPRHGGELSGRPGSRRGDPRGSGRKAGASLCTRSGSVSLSQPADPSVLTAGPCASSPLVRSMPPNTVTPEGWRTRALLRIERWLGGQREQRRDAHILG